jgi:hypothetical protein
MLVGFYRHNSSPDPRIEGMDIGGEVTQNMRRYFGGIPSVGEWRDADRYYAYPHGFFSPNTRNPVFASSE